MAKKQTYISFLNGKDGKTLDFQRWACKRPETIIKNLRTLYNGAFSNLYELDKAATVTIHATPDGYNEEKTPVLTVPISDIYDANR